MIRACLLGLEESMPLDYDTWLGLSDVGSRKLFLGAPQTRS